MVINNKFLKNKTPEMIWSLLFIGINIFFERYSLFLSVYFPIASE